jgi:hypothetical protein
MSDSKFNIKDLFDHHCGNTCDYCQMRSKFTPRELMMYGLIIDAHSTWNRSPNKDYDLLSKLVGEAIFKMRDL